LDIPPLQ